MARREKGGGEKGNRHHEGQNLAGATLGEPFLDSRKKNTAGGYRPPKCRQRERCQHGARSELLRHVERRPVAVHRLADAVQECERRKHPEPRGEIRPALLGFGGTASRRSPRGKGRLNESSATASAPTSTGRPHQIPNPTKIATKTGASAVPTPSKAFSTSTALSTLCGKNAAAKVLIAGTVSPNPTPMQVVAINKMP